MNKRVARKILNLQVKSDDPTLRKYADKGIISLVPFDRGHLVKLEDNVIEKITKERMKSTNPKIRKSIETIEANIMNEMKKIKSSKWVSLEKIEKDFGINPEEMSALAWAGEIDSRTIGQKKFYMISTDFLYTLARNRKKGKGYAEEKYIAKLNQYETIEVTI